MRYVLRLWTVDDRKEEEKNSSGLRKVRGEMVISAGTIGEVLKEALAKAEKMTKKQQASIGKVEIAVETENASGSTPFDNVK